jgi:hypothetical protein
MGTTKTAGRIGRWLAAASSLAKGRFRKFIPLVLLLIGVGFAIEYAWQRWGVPAMQGPQYRLSAEQMIVTPQPAWIHTNVKEDVIRDGQLTELQLLDPHLAEKISRAFTLHSWVAKVVEVRKEYPAKLTVTVEYRQPVAMVEVAAATGPGLLFVDADGILLPSDDFAIRQTKDFLRIQAPHATPAGVYGTTWGDVRIERSARLAKYLKEHWQALGIYRIRVVEGLGTDMLLELETGDGQVVRWGHAPGEEVPPERTAEEKLRFLQAAPKGKLPESVDGRT